MKNTVTELFLSEYFLIQAILGKYLDKEKELFYSLGKMFFLTDEKLGSLYALSVNERAKEITSAGEFMQHQRIQKYSRLTGLELASDSECEEIINVKGNAITTALNSHLKLGPEVSQNVLYNNLARLANSGLVHALRIMGILNAEGVFVDKNISASIRYLSKSADWNDVVSVLALLRLCEDKREYNLSRLNCLTKDTPFAQLYGYAAEYYKTDGVSEIKEIRLVEKAFNSGVLKRETYDAKYARIIYCKALHFKEKQRAIHIESKEIVSAIADLPLKLSRDRSGGIDLSILDNVTLQREKELAKIAQILGNSDLRGLYTYHPLCLCSDSKYLLNMYADVLAKKSDGVHTERIDVANLADYDFEPTPNNIFLRGLDEDRDNYLLIFLCGDISERALNAVKNFIGNGRSKFHLNSPRVTIDLREVLPIIFADKKNAKLLSEQCDLVELESVTNGEKLTAVEHMLARKKTLYRVSEITITNETYGLFENCEIDDIENILDDAIRSFRTKDGAVKLSMENLTAFFNNVKKNVIGFGGADK